MLEKKIIELYGDKTCVVCLKRKGELYYACRDYLFWVCPACNDALTLNKN